MIKSKELQKVQTTVIQKKLGGDIQCVSAINAAASASDEKEQQQHQAEGRDIQDRSVEFLLSLEGCGSKGCS